MMKKLSIPQVPIIELYLRSGLQRSHGSFVPFITAAISGAFLLLTAAVLSLTVYKEIKKRGKNQSA